MLPAVTWEYSNTGTFTPAPMCIVSIRVFVSKHGTPQRNLVTAPQRFGTPLIQINVPRSSEKVTLPVRVTRQAQTPERGNHPAPVVAPSVPDSVPAPAPPPPYLRDPALDSRRSSIRRAGYQPSLNGSRFSKKVHFFIPDSDHSLSSPDSGFSLLDPPPPVAIPSEPKAMAIEEKPTAQVTTFGNFYKEETETDFSSDIDDGEMVQRADIKETQGGHDYLYRTDRRDLDSDSGSAIDDFEPALSIPMRRDVTSGPSFAQPHVSHHYGRGFAPSGHVAHHRGSERSENATRRLKTEQRPADSFRQPMHPGDWENESVAGSTIDDSVHAIRAPLSSYTMGYKRPVSLQSARFPFTTHKASDSAQQGVKSHNRESHVDHATEYVPFKPSTAAAQGLPQTRPDPIFVRRRRDRRIHDFGIDGTIEDGSDGSDIEMFQSRAQDLRPRTSQQTTCEVRYDSRTGTISYYGLRNGYAYATKVRRP